MNSNSSSLSVISGLFWFFKGVTVNHVIDHSCYTGHSFYSKYWYVYIIIVHLSNMKARQNLKHTINIGKGI